MVDRLGEEEERDKQNTRCGDDVVQKRKNGNLTPLTRQVYHIIDKKQEHPAFNADCSTSYGYK